MNDTPDPRETPRHPRHRRRLVGHDKAEASLLAAHRAGKLHHAWLIAGPRGVGKATLAYRFARFLLDAGGGQAGLLAANSLDATSDGPAAQLVSARSHPDLLVIERTLDRDGKRLKAQIAAEDARAAGQFFSRTPAMGGYRVCIVDAADDLNPTAANALLKILEEPPRQALFLLIAHAPGKLLPTIRSRAVSLNLAPLPTEKVVDVLSELEVDAEQAEIESASALAQGSPGRALELIGSGGARLFLDARSLIGSRKPADRRRLFEIAGAMQRREAADDFQIFAGLLVDWLSARARGAALQGPTDEAESWARMSLEIGHSIRRTNALNLDRRQLLLEAFDTVEQASGR